VIVEGLWHVVISRDCRPRAVEISQEPVDSIDFLATTIGTLIASEDHRIGWRDASGFAASDCECCLKPVVTAMQQFPCPFARCSEMWIGDNG
jgi:hypothetical protein